MDKNKRWEYFDVEKLFSISYAKVIDEDTLNPGPYPHISARSSNNGVLDFYDKFTEIGGVLTIETACNGFCSYQKENFSSHGHLAVLRPKFEMNDRIGLFFSTIFNFECKYYYYGRKRTIRQIKK